jgi:hypothetical protein
MSQSIVDRSSLMMGTRGIIKIRNGAFIGDTVSAAKQAKHVRIVLFSVRFEC